MGTVIETHKGSNNTLQTILRNKLVIDLNPLLQCRLQMASRIFPPLHEPPLKQRVFPSTLAAPVYVQPSLGGGYKQWDSESMAHAMKAVINEGVSIRRAAERYNIPRSTLGDRISGRVLPGSGSGPPRVLTDCEERELEEFLYHCSCIGYGKTRNDIISLVNRILRYRGSQRSVSNGWWASFRKRHHNLFYVHLQHWGGLDIWPLTRIQLMHTLTFWKVL